MRGSSEVSILLTILVFVGFLFYILGSMANDNITTIGFAERDLSIPLDCGIFSFICTPVQSVLDAFGMLFSLTSGDAFLSAIIFLPIVTIAGYLVIRLLRGVGG